MESALNRQQRRSVIEIRNRNMAEKRFLQNRLTKLDDDVKDYKTGFDKTVKELKTQCKSSEQSDLQEYYNSFPTLAKVTRGLDITSAQSYRQPTSMMMKQSKKPGKKCKFCDNGTPCYSFPCYIPTTYNSLGFDINLNRHNSLDRFITSSQTSADVRDKLLAALEEDSVRRPLKCDLNRISERERGLKRVIEDMRLRNIARKPVDYSVHYGAPISRRRLTKVPPSSTDVS